MDNQRRRVLKHAVNSMIAFKKRGTPGGDEYTRRLRIAIRCVVLSDYGGANKWIDLCDVPEEQG